MGILYLGVFFMMDLQVFINVKFLSSALENTFFSSFVTYKLLDEKIDISNLSDLSKEAMGVMDVFKNMSHRFIEKDEWLMMGVMGANSVSEYPLDWTKLPSGIKKFSDVPASELASDPGFNNNKVATNQMTYVLVNNDASNDFTTDQLKRLNILNKIWKN
mmetsp:Transcript_24503/g.28179  ORF Transcript_24503/g.28179 Transcript_24503/m.28179 type:complete len:160 (+) Transcript_24503:398-877(+)